VGVVPRRILGREADFAADQLEDSEYEFGELSRQDLQMAIEDKCIPGTPSGTRAARAVP
jgi:hypothetical protein